MCSSSGPPFFLVPDTTVTTPLDLINTGGDGRPGANLSLSPLQNMTPKHRGLFTTGTSDGVK